MQVSTWAGERKPLLQRCRSLSLSLHTWCKHSCKYEIFWERLEKTLSGAWLPWRHNFGRSCDLWWDWLTTKSFINLHWSFEVDLVMRSVSTCHETKWNVDRRNMNLFQTYWGTSWTFQGTRSSIYKSTRWPWPICCPGLVSGDDVMVTLMTVGDIVDYCKPGDISRALPRSFPE